MSATLPIHQPPNKGRILVVDDDRLVLATLTHGLEEAGYQVIDADNGDEAILLARQHRPDLALLDIRMAGMSGFDVAAYLREFLQMPFMFLSAFNDDETAAQVRSLGAVAYLVKPLDIRQIVPAVEAALTRSAQAPATHARAERAQAVNDAPSEVVAIATGVLMHRYSLDRRAARERLSKLALSEGRSADDQAELLIQAVEVLGRPSLEA